MPAAKPSAAKVRKRIPGSPYFKSVAPEVTHYWEVHLWRRADQEEFARTGISRGGGHLMTGFARGRDRAEQAVAKRVEGAKRGEVYRHNSVETREAPFADYEVEVTIEELECV